MHEALEPKPDIEQILREEYSRVQIDLVSGGDFGYDIPTFIAETKVLSAEKDLLLRIASGIGIVLQADGSINPPETIRQGPI